MLTILISALVLAHLLAALYLINKLIEEIQNQRNPHRGKKPARARKRPRAVNRSLETRLVLLLRNDIQAAHRLVSSARSRHPGRHENWYWEKAIADLERDRR
ncbi:MAG TPA: hypothetical protein V6D48_22930 [Oculatellaceae cyanobacterium]